MADPNQTPPADTRANPDHFLVGQLPRGDRLETDRGPRYKETPPIEVLTGPNPPAVAEPYNAVTAALFARERTGEAPVVDLSLLGMGMWAMGMVIAGSLAQDKVWTPLPRVPETNALAGTYATQDGRWIALVCLQAFRYWPEFCRVVGHPEWALDPRFATAELLQANSVAASAAIDALFASRPRGPSWSWPRPDRCPPAHLTSRRAS